MLPEFCLSGGIPSWLSHIPLSCHICFHLLSTFMFHAPFSQETSCADNRPAGVSYQMLWLLISSPSLTCLSQNRQNIFRIYSEYLAESWEILSYGADCRFLSCCTHFRDSATFKSCSYFRHWNSFASLCLPCRSSCWNTWTAGTTAFRSDFFRLFPEYSRQKILRKIPFYFHCCEMDYTDIKVFLIFFFNQMK